MTTVLPARLRAPVLGRAAAVLALASAAVHLVLAASGDVSAVAMAGMALVCVPCAMHLWRAPTASVWGLTALVDLGMLALHAPVVAGHGMHHGAGAGHVALGLVAAQLVLAAVALLRR
ncbi:hypothetical protein [Klenkia taihuensis]|uniref:Uncharacterized protein n=1 Tax=Klenkia taihuensis TaxID=1225127 RepID=A0A1I1V811_9ACTN|nr:hypothetical protein [Klenkia taihuensis]GHE14617.1 hypothetical protein GCM10011381_41930 [Klenkia taihuensis]SFD76540.1 hypothetical protein SAMN05661030_4162 [Klenkia taihuensis]